MVHWSHKDINKKIQDALAKPIQTGQPANIIDRMKAAAQNIRGIPQREM